MRSLRWVLVPLLGGGCAPLPGSEGDYVADLLGQNEVPPVESDASGEVWFQLRDGETALDFAMTLAGDGLLAAEGAHLHCAPAGEDGPIVAWLAGEIPGGFSGSSSVRATLTDANLVDDACGATLSELAASIEAGLVYVNVHSAAHPDGEIRGQVNLP